MKPIELAHRALVVGLAGITVYYTVFNTSVAVNVVNTSKAAKARSVAVVFALFTK